MKIVFMGTPDFAVSSLKALIEAGHQIVGVVTAPDTLGGRGGHQLIQSAIKKFALSRDLLILQPQKLRSLEFLKRLQSLEADIQVVVAFRMLPTVVWDMPPHGTVNVHGSLLPKYRGAAPIHWAVINGEKETGVTVFKLKHEIDTGEIIEQRMLSISADDTTGMVYDGLMQLGAETLVSSISKIEAGTAQYLIQNDASASAAPKIYHEDCDIDFSKTCHETHNFIRGLNPKPTAWFRHAGIKYFIHLSKLSPLFANSPAQQGPFLIRQNNLYLQLADGLLRIEEIQPEGKRKMTGSDFINGIKNNPAFKALFM